jgi:hypothetical protein
MYAYIIILSIIISIGLNILLPTIASKFATEKQIKPPPNGAASLNIWDQFMHMLVHHKQVLFTSSLLVALIVGTSVSLAILVVSKSNIK